jgi:hypothetical protein
LKPIRQELTEENLSLHQSLLSDNISNHVLHKIIEIHLQYHDLNRDLALGFFAVRDTRSTLIRYPFDPQLPCCPPIDTATASPLHHGHASDDIYRPAKRRKNVECCTDIAQHLYGENQLT